MTAESSDFRTPGQLIRALLDKHGWTKRVLAIVLGVDESGINRLVKDLRPVDAKMALALEELFGVPAERFLDLQKSFDLAQARIVARPDPARATRAHLFGELPVAEMIKRGWLIADDVRDVRGVEGALTRFFKVSRVEDIEVLPHAAKKTLVNAATTPAQLAWLYRVREIASEMIVSSFSQHSAGVAISKLGDLLSAPEEARKVPRILAEAGIRFVIVETLSSAKIDGVCFWLNEDSPVVGMTMRFDRIDNFWFVLRHELEHVIRGHGQSTVMLDAELEGEKAGTGDEIAEEERVANEAAANFCVPKKMMDAFIARKAPFFYERDIIGFARTIKVHPGLVAGQIRHRTNRYDRFANHLTKIRSAIAPSAIVDGWGDVVPTGS
jgi:HTH-type transcriptional regulator/antitoxin HigA